MSLSLDVFEHNVHINYDTFSELVLAIGCVEKVLFVIHLATKLPWLNIAHMEVNATNDF